MSIRGKEVKAKSGKRYRIGRLIEAGGQGEASEATDDKGARFVFKRYHDAFKTDATRTRLNFIAGQKLADVCRTLFSPVDVVDDGRELGHVSPKAPGVSLEDLLTAGAFDLVTALQITTAMAHSFAVLHDRGIAHGDIHPKNILVHLRHDNAESGVIDFDNLAAAGLPDAPCLGHHLYMAPEIRRASGGPSIEADCFALAVLVHEVLLLRHVAAGHDGDEESFLKAMTCGQWLQDPAHPGSARTNALGGYPAEILDPGLARLIRRGVSTDGALRPRAAQWRDVLYRAMYNVYSCPNCGAPYLVDTSKRSCPACRWRYSMLGLKGSFGLIKLEAASTVIGRAQLGGSPKVSTRHAVIRRVGPEYRVQDYSANGTYRRTSHGWVRLPSSDEVEKQPLIRAGDELRFADVEAAVVEA